MKRNQFIIISLVWFSIVFPGDTFAETTQNCLWKITNEKNTVYLLGSIHLLSQASYPLDSAISAAFDSAQVLVFEIELDSLQSPRIQQLMLSKAMFSDGQTLPKVLKPETYAFAAKHAQAIGLPIEQLHSMKPWFLAVSIMTLKLQQMGFNPELGVDKYFFNLAKQQEKPVLGLETAEFQINLFDQISGENPDEVILQILTEFDVFEKEISGLVAAWSTGNLAALDSIMFKSFAEYPEIYQDFVVRRNQNWLPQIEAFCQADQNYLVIVGTGHLVGKEGLIRLLTEKGYSIEQQ